MAERCYNFSAGPSMLPLSVLERAQSEFLSYGDSGMNVMEMSHRSAVYIDIFNKTVASFRELMGIPDTYKVLLLQGGAMGQFAAVPMNLLPPDGEADYVISGNFARAAFKEAKKFGNVRAIASSEADNFTYIPEIPEGALNPKASYVHITTNNTIFGTRYAQLPDTGAVPLVADMSSNILSEPYDVNQFGLIYAGAQKNLGIAGMTAVIVRESLLGNARVETPAILNYQVQADNDSMINTPSTYAIYIFGLMLDWMRAQGGVSSLEQQNIEKSQLLYDFIDNSKAFVATAQEAFRSRMNVTFVCKDASLNDSFVKQAAKEGLVNLKGHRLVGGMRASIYNAMPKEGILALIDFMKRFEQQVSV